MLHFNQIPVASYVCGQSARNQGSYKLMCYTSKQNNGKREMPDARRLSFLAYDKTTSEEMAINRLIKMGLSQRNDAIHVFDNHIFNAETIKLPFGKYKGLLLEDVYLKDPSYIAWLAGTVKPTSLVNRCIQLQCSKWTISKQPDPVIEFRNRNNKQVA
ncbi:exodeoxyribonuclease X C-terminal domain-containing protein [Shewanella inventionis]|nr:hypothetical protein [Shewanella inventionis]